MGQPHPRMSQEQPPHGAKSRRHFNPADKVRILRLHLVERRPISEICQQEDIQPSLFYYWQRIFFEHGAAAFERAGQSPKAVSEQQKTIAKLEARLVRKDYVIATVTEELVRTKKELGEN